MLLHKDNPLMEYKPYTEYILELPQYVLRSLPDGTADEITPAHYIQRIDPETMTELENPIFTPIEWDNTYPEWMYGLVQVFDADSNLTMAQMEIEYPLDLLKQTDTNTCLVQRNESRIAQNTADINMLQSRVTQNEADINTLQSSIQSNENRIAQNEADINTLQSQIETGFEILYNDKHDFRIDEYFYTQDFVFENGATYALELRLGRLYTCETRIFTFTPGSADFNYVDVSFVSLDGVETNYAKLATCLLRVYADKIRLLSTAGLNLNNNNNDITRYIPSYIRLRKIIKLR